MVELGGRDWLTERGDKALLSLEMRVKRLHQEKGILLDLEETLDL